MEESYLNLYVFLSLWLIRHNQGTEFEGINYCVMVAENHFSTTILGPNETSSHCLPFDCWNSQLEFGFKFQLSRYYNSFRNNFAMSTNVTTIYKTVWHWVLEKEAISIAKECPTPRIAIMPKRDVYGLGYNMICEESIALFKLITISTFSLSEMYHKLLQDENDPLGNFDEFGNFRRPSASHFGCSIMLVGVSGRLVCVYCAKDRGTSVNPMEELSEECPLSTSRKASEYKYLCTPNSRYMNDMFACNQLDVITKFCNGSPTSDIWHVINVIRNAVLYPVTTGLLSTYVMRYTRDAIEDIENNTVLSCDDLGECPPILPKWAYLFNQTTLTMLNRTLLTSHYGVPIQFGQNDAVVKFTQDDTVYYWRAGCCFYLCVLFLIPFVIVCLLAYFTYKHSKRNKIE